MEWLGVVLGILGLIPAIVVGAEFARNVLPSRRFLDFRSPHGSEIIVTTSSSGISGIGPSDEAKRAKRDLLPSGDLAGVGEVCGLLGRAYPRRPFVITSSSREQDDRRRDQLLVGGPIHNRYTAQLICGDLRDATGQTAIVFDAARRYVRLGTFEIGPDVDLNFEANLPQTEYAIILLSEVHRYGGSQRIVAIGGMTTYGTYAAGHFVAHDLAPFARASGLGRRPNVCILIKALLVNGQPYDIRVLHHVPVDRADARRESVRPAWLPPVPH